MSGAPYRAMIAFTLAADTLTEADERVAAVVAEVERLGCFFELASVGEMKEEDVIEGSPLHRAWWVS